MKNNLDIVRLFAAFLVMYSHGYTLTGRPEPVFLSWATLGPLGVFIFFILSGYLIAQSWDADPHVLRYFARRALRIFPALAFCTLLSVFVLGPLLTTWTLDRYFSSEALRNYLLNVFLYISYYLPGVFEHHRVPNAVNGSLWSLPVEFFMYVVVAATGLLFRGSRWAYLALCAGFAAVCLLWAYPRPSMLVIYATDVSQVAKTGIYFLVGAAIYKFNLARLFSLSWVCVAFVMLLCLEPWPSVSRVAAWGLLPVIVLGFGLASSRRLGLLVKHGDYSYGVYIYAFPVQQTLVQLFPGMGIVAYQTATAAITLALAALSWHWIEKPMLALKPARRRQQPLRTDLYEFTRTVYRRLPQTGGLKARLRAYAFALGRRYNESFESAQNRRALAALLEHRTDFSPDFRALGNGAGTAIPIDVTVVTYNSAKWLPALLASLVRQDYPPDRLALYVVDNGSTDGTLDVLADLKAKHGAALRRFEIFRRPNLGFGTGHNFAIAQGDAEFVLVANPDLEFEADAIVRVVGLALADDARAASWEFRQKPYEHPKHYDPVTWETNWSSHACVLLRRLAWREVGGYDEKIFLYAEDVEFSYRLRSRGYRLRYCPTAVVWHYTYDCAEALKPAQYIGSLVGNLHVRLRYGNRRDMADGIGFACAALARPEPFAGARRRLLRALLGLARRAPAILLSRRSCAADFPLRGFDYELVRAGAFVMLEKPLAAPPLVSVVTRTYRGRGDYLRQAAVSVFRQTYGNVEWIVVEDGGNTLSEEVARLAERSNRPVRYISLDKVGRSAAGNEGLRQARGDLLMFLDDDDLLYADHVEVLAAALADEAYAAAYALCWMIPTDVEDGRLREGSYTTPAFFHQPYDYDVLSHRNFIPIQAILFRRELFAERGGFDIELDQLEDWNLWLRYGYREQFLFVPKTTSLFRIPADPTIMAKRQALLDAALATASERAAAWRPEYDARITAKRWTARKAG